MKPSRIILAVLNLLLGAFLAFGLLFFIERLLRQPWEWYSQVMACWPILLCWAVGLAGRRLESLRIPLLGGALLLAAVVMGLLLRSWSFWPAAYRVLALIPGAGLYLVGLKGDEPFPPRFAVAGMLVYLLEVLRHGGEPEASALCWCGLFALLLTMYSFNTASVTAGVHNVKGGETMSLPAGIRGKNLLLLTGFLLICFFIANIGFLRTAANAVWQFIWGGIAAFFKWITNLGTTSTSGPPPTEYVPEQQTMHPIEIEGEHAPVFVTIYGVFWGIVCVIFFLLAYGFARENKGGGMLRRLSDALRRLMRTRQVMEYEDDVEQADLKTIVKKQREAVRRAWKKITVRRRKFTDMPDDVSRVRYAYRALIRSKYGEDWTPDTTPAELGRLQQKDSLRQLTEEYNLVRYDPDKPLNPDCGELAARAVKEMGAR